MVGGKGNYGDDFEYAAEGHTLTGTGTFETKFVGLKGTLSPGTSGAIGSMTFKHAISAILPFKWLIDIASAGSFDELHYEGGGEANLSDSLVEGHVISPYAPAKGTQWRFLALGGAFCVTCGEATKGFALVSVSGGEALGLTGSFRKPTVVTGSTPSPARTTATPEGTVNPNGTEVTACFIEYGTTDSYGSSVPCSPRPGNKTHRQPVHSRHSGLRLTTQHTLPRHDNEGGTIPTASTRPSRPSAPRSPTPGKRN